MSKIIIIGTSPNSNCVQRLKVSSSGNVTEQLEDGPQVPVYSVYGASAIIDDSQTIITLIRGHAQTSGSDSYDLVWILNTQNISPS